MVKSDYNRVLTYNQSILVIYVHSGMEQLKVKVGLLIKFESVFNSNPGYVCLVSCS
jgi:hypothetical protein